MFKRLPLAGICALLIVQIPKPLLAQRAFEKGDDVIYEDARNNQSNLGPGFNPILTTDGNVALIRGPHLIGQNAEFDCNDRRKKNWIIVYDPIAKTEKTLFDRIIPFDNGKWPYCIYQQMQLSPTGQTLYLVSPVYATSGSLAIVRLPEATITYVPGVNSVYVIETGPHRGELIYDMRTFRRDPSDGNSSPYYPIVHAKANGQQIQEISEEVLAVGGQAYSNAPILEAYLRQIGGSITLNGQRFPTDQR